MAIEFDIVVKALANEGSNSMVVDFDLNGETPKMVIAYTTRAEAVGFETDAQTGSLSLWDGTDEFTISGHTPNGSASPHNTSSRVNSFFFIEDPLSAFRWALGSVASATADQITISWSEGPVFPLLATFLAVGGSDFDVALRDHNFGGGPTSTAITGIGFQPNAQAWFSTGGTMPAATFGGSQIQVGFASDGTQGLVQHFSGVRFSNATNEANYARAREDFIHANIGTAGVEGSTATVSSMDSDGYTVSHSGAVQAFVLSMRFGTLDPLAFNFATPESTSSTLDVDIGLSPDLLFMFLSRVSEFATSSSDPSITGDNAGVQGFSFVDGATQVCAVGVRQDGADPNVAVSYQNNSAALVLPEDDGDLGAEAVVATVSLSAFSSGPRFTFSQDDSNAPHQIIGLALGDPMLNLKDVVPETVNVQETVSQVVGKYRVVPGEVVNITDASVPFVVRRDTLASEKLQSASGGFVVGETSAGKD